MVWKTPVFSKAYEDLKKIMKIWNDKIILVPKVSEKSCIVFL